MMETAHPLPSGEPRSPGARLVGDGVEFAVFSRHGSSVDICLFDETGARETARWRLAGRDGDIHHGFAPGVGVGARDGLRVDGPWAPADGDLFDPAKLLVDPRATRIDRPLRWRPELALPRDRAVDTAPFVPRAIVEAAFAPAPRFERAGPPALIYEAIVKAHTILDPRVDPAARGTLRGLAAPHVVERVARLGVSHVELMPVAAAMTERHLAAIGLENAWGYNSACFMALDPRLAPGGLADLRAAVDAFRTAGIGVVLDVVFNHSAESDLEGPTLNLRGLDNAVYYRAPAGRPGELVNVTGCGNTLASDRGPVVDLIVASLRHFALNAGVAGFRFDLAATLARGDEGFPSPHPLFEAIDRDPVLNRLVMIAEPWDIGPGGYRLGAFREPWMEWNDRYRDRVRRFWRGDAGAVAEFATALAGSADTFAASRAAPSASVNFVAAHDGFSLLDLVSRARKSNEANGENNRDGADENFSWNCGHEGDTDDPAVVAARQRDARALLACLFLSRGAPMLTAGDEILHTRLGNNNAYAQDNAANWLDWTRADAAFASYAEGLSTLRRALAPLNADRFLTGRESEGEAFADVVWLNADGSVRADSDWGGGDTLCFALDAGGERVFVAFNRGASPTRVVAPSPRDGRGWFVALDSAAGKTNARGGEPWPSPGVAQARSALLLVERPAAFVDQPRSRPD